MIRLEVAAAAWSERAQAAALHTWLHVWLYTAGDSQEPNVAQDPIVAAKHVITLAGQEEESAARERGESIAPMWPVLRAVAYRHWQRSVRWRRRCSLSTSKPYSKPSVRLNLTQWWRHCSSAEELAFEWATLQACAQAWQWWCYLASQSSSVAGAWHHWLQHTRERRTRYLSLIHI